jgi:hypothetical protein
MGVGRSRNSGTFLCFRLRRLRLVGTVEEEDDSFKLDLERVIIQIKTQQSEKESRKENLFGFYKFIKEKRKYFWLL